MKSRVLLFLDNIERIVIISVFLVLLLMMIFGIVTRYGFGISVAWVEQMTRLLFVWLSFSGISYASKERAHLKVEALAVFASGKKGKIILLLGNIIAAVFAFYLSYKIGMLTLNVAGKSQSFSAMNWMPVWVMYLAGVVGLGGMGIRTIQFSILPEFKELITSNKKERGD